MVAAWCAGGCFDDDKKSSEDDEDDGAQVTGMRRKGLPPGEYPKEKNGLCFDCWNLRHGRRPAVHADHGVCHGHFRTGPVSWTLFFYGIEQVEESKREETLKLTVPVRNYNSKPSKQP
ncbi:hypothetical protein RUM44_009776 [Polyplax serrata]|uniref:Uncharacterized protein n=1 Tax=Polyplax serrata TaxID=468196 RepID=A0ABR1ATM1_POLSC